MNAYEKIRAALEQAYKERHEPCSVELRIDEALAALAELEKAATQFVAGEVADEMCDRAYISKWRGVPELIGHEPDDEDRQWSREWLEAWRSELGPTLGLVEIREPSDDECRAIWREAKANEGDGSKICAGRAMFDACRAVLWPKEGL